MKTKAILFITLLSTGCSSAFASNSITISGTIESTSCTVSTDTADQTVFLGDIASKQFYQVGATSMPIKFTVDLQNCTTSISDAAVTFSGQTNSTTPALLALDAGDNTASGIGIAILDVNRTLIPLNSPSSNYTIDGNNSDNQLVFYAQYQATDSVVSAGSATATATFSLTYQ